MKVVHGGEGRIRGTSARVTGCLVSGTSGRSAGWHVPEEMPVVMMLNGASFAVMMATPHDLEDFAIGFSITEGIVRRATDIAEIRVAEAADGMLVNIVVEGLSQDAAAARKRTLAGRSSCGICGAQSLDAALPPLPRVSGTRPAAEAVRRAFEALPAHQDMNALNRSTHAAAKCSLSGGIECVREDIGRHNALDKLGGALARSDARADDGFILLSSRISIEMVQKAAMFGAPFLAAVSAPSALALRTAAVCGMGLACHAGGEVMIFDGAPVEPVEEAGRRAASS